jgi:adenylate kinase
MFLLIICTGISGSGKEEYISSVKKIAESKGKLLNVVNVGDLMYKKSEELGAPIPKGNILEISERHLDLLRATVFEEIIRIKDETDNLLVNTHACFRWHKHLTNAFDYYYLYNLNPDLYITIIDNIYSIFGRLQESQWRQRNNLLELLMWRNEEEFITKIFADIQKKPHFVVARNEPPETLFNLVFQPTMKKVYISYPISAAENEDLQRVQNVIKELRNTLIVFDPLSIREVEWLTLALALKKKSKKRISIPFVSNEGSEKRILINIEELEQIASYLKDHTISRDYSLVRQSDLQAVYYYDPELPSPGVQREIRYARENGKNVYIYYPKATMSLFQEMDLTQHFQEESKFVAFLKKL